MKNMNRALYIFFDDAYATQYGQQNYTCFVEVNFIQQLEAI